MRLTVIRITSLVQGFIIVSFVSATVVCVTGGLSVALYLVLPRLAAVADLWPGVSFIRDGAVKVVVEDNAVSE